jgi:hypothetical protein
MTIVISNPIRSTFAPTQAPQATPVSAPTPAAQPADQFVKSIFAGQRSSTVIAPLTIALPADLTMTQATARFSVPASALLADPNTLASVSLGEPWTTGAVSFKVDGDQVRFEVPNADASAFSKLAPSLQLRYADGRAELLSVKSDALTVDDSANKRANLANEVNVAQQMTSFFSDRLAALKAGPIPAESQPELDRWVQRRDAAQAAVDAARPGITTKVSQADYVGLITMSMLGDDQVESLRSAAVTAQNAALGGTDAQKAAEKMATEALRSALLANDSRLASADRVNGGGPFAQAYGSLGVASTEVDQLEGLVSRQVASNAVAREKGLSDTTAALADWQGKFDADRQALADFSGSTQTVPVTQISLP